MLTDRAVRNAKPEPKAYKLPDDDGLYLHILPGGAKTWRVRYDRAGKEQVMTLGRYPAMTLAEARAERTTIKSTLRAGLDPVAERARAEAAAALAAANTFESVARAWFARQTWTGKHAGQVIGSLEKDVFPTLGQSPIASITPKQVIDVLRPIEERPAVETAHRTRQRMSAVFVFGIATRVCDADPAAIVKRALAPVVHKRQPAEVDIEAVRKVILAAEAIPAQPTTRLALRLLAVTAVRPGELRGARPEEFEGLDTDAPAWRIPAERMKMKREHIVPLSRQALDLIALARGQIGRGGLLFPSVRHAHRPMSENAIGYLLNRAGYHGKHVPHGFRSAFSTVMNERFPADRAIIDLMLAHAPKDKVEAAYNRAQHLARRRELAQAWADMLLDGLPSPAEIIATPRRINR
jgi:integrase